jgi:hypothetical protein
MMSKTLKASIVRSTSTTTITGRSSGSVMCTNAPHRP